MDILDVEDLHDHDHDHDDDHDGVKFDHQVLLDSAAAAAALDASSALPGAGTEDDGDGDGGEDGGVTLPDDDDDDDEVDDGASLHQMALRGESAAHNRSTHKRRKIGKALQLVLLRKYVQCAKQLDHLPSRVMTEQLLEEGYDEFYFHGGSLREPRLGYTTFLKLVRNRRGEVMRQTRDLQTLSHGRGSRRHQKERLEIRMLIEELERVRQSHLRSPLDYDALDGSDTAGSSSGGTVSMLSSATDQCAAESASHHHQQQQHDVAPVAGAAAAAGASSASGLVDTTAELHVGDDVLISREKLDMMLRFAQETLKAQKKILDEVRAIERRLELNQL